MDIMNLDIKSYYRFVKYTFMMDNDDIPHEKMKLIILGKEKPLSKSENKLKHFADAYLYLLNNLCSSFNEDIILKSYFILTNEIIDTEVVKKIYLEYCLNMDEQPHAKALKVHDCVVKNVQFENIKFALMIANYLMLKNERRTIVITPESFEHYKSLFIVDDAPIDKKLLFFINNEGAMKRNHNLNVKNISLSEIIEKLTQYKQRIMEFGVNKLFIFGSVAKKTNHESSDLDLLIVTKEGMINLEKRIREIELQRFLEEKLEINVDIVDFGQAIFSFCPNELENIITIF